MNAEVNPRRINKGFLFNTECMNFLECDLEEIIMKTPNEELRKRGLRIWGKKKQQLKVGNYGRLDILTHDKQTAFMVSENKMYFEKPTISIYELKKDKISISAFMQAVGYLKGVATYLRQRNIDTGNYDFRIILIGSSIDTDSSLCYLPDMLYGGLFELEIYTYSYEFDGIKFKEESGYNLIETGF